MFIDTDSFGNVDMTLFAGHVLRELLRLLSIHFRLKSIHFRLKSIHFACCLLIVYINLSAKFL